MVVFEPNVPGLLYDTWAMPTPLTLEPEYALVMVESLTAVLVAWLCPTYIVVPIPIRTGLLSDAHATPTPLTLDPEYEYSAVELLMAVLVALL
jgi:hypothetical protein